MDEADQAQLISDRYLTGEVARARAGLARACVAHLLCVDCWEETPEARRVAVPGCERCVGCQEAAEDPASPLRGYAVARHGA